jgi:O-antigen ligase
MKKHLFTVLKWAVIIIALFKLIELSFWLLNLKDTIGNIVGLLLIVTIATVIVTYTITSIKDIIKQIKNLD